MPEEERRRRGRRRRLMLCRRFRSRDVPSSLAQQSVAPALDVPLVERRSVEEAVPGVDRGAVGAQVGLELGGGVDGGIEEMDS